MVDPGLRAALGCNARVYAESWFRIKDIGERFEAISYTMKRIWPVSGGLNYDAWLTEKTQRGSERLFRFGTERA